IFSAQTLLGFNADISTARFANVAFSNGSLLESFVRRLEKRQPLAVPRAVERYFVSPHESGEICTLAAFGAPNGSIVVPDFESKISLVPLEDVARDFLRHHGFDPIELEDEDAARAAVPQDGTATGYPLLLTPLDTSGEKPYEEFVGQGEQLVDLGLSSVAAVGYTGCDLEKLKTVLWTLKAACQGDRMVSRDMLIGQVSDLVPQFKYILSDAHLDQRM
ncbi:MAG: polysaccharide biosynthesis protein, partial [Pseudomonadota bacterium]